MVKFFINRPIFATVLALILVVAGLVTLHILPIAQYPEITLITPGKTLNGASMHQKHPPANVACSY